MHITCCAAVKLGTSESVLEAHVSVFERHFHNDGWQDGGGNECPSLVEADGVIEKAMRAYFKFKRWHFVKTTDIRDCFNKSQVLKRLKGQVSKLPFMKT